MSLKQPMQYPVSYYSHLDAGAPQLADADGVIKTILKACLVTGYGDKEGAGWTALFDDAFRIVLRRPLRTGNPPDIKIENGVINGTASHRIVSQDNPTGLDDATELAAVNLLARDSRKGVEWHLIVSDFGFILCYQMGENAAVTRNHILYCGSTQKIEESAPDGFFSSSLGKIARNGVVSIPASSVFYESGFMKDMRNNTTHSSWAMLDLNTTEKQFNNDYLVQTVILNNTSILPFYVAMSKEYTDLLTSVVVIDGRSMLRYVNKMYSATNHRVIYIPLDYWEL